VAQLQKELAAHDLDGAVFTDEPSVYYLTGLRSPSFLTHTRPVVVVVPASGPTTLVCSRSQAPNAEATAWVGDIRSFEGFEIDAEPHLADLLRGLAKRGRIGAEMGTDLRLGLSAGAFDRLRSAISPSEVVDVASLIWKLRSRKSPWEVAALRRAGRINGAAFDTARDSYRHGMTERDFYAVWSAALMSMGADSPGYLAMHSGSGNYNRVSGLPTERVLRAGDLLWMDGGPRYLGYWSDITRTYAVGTVKDEHQRLYAASRDATRSVGQAMRPGVTTVELFDLVAETFREAGLQIGSATRIGHGIGIDLTEPPSVVPGDAVRLGEGMALAIEPGIARHDGYFNVEENFILTAAGSELLSTPVPPEIEILGA
jgi:Xaa-Pro dipeptidase